MKTLQDYRQTIRDQHLAADAEVLNILRQSADISPETRADISASALSLIQAIRDNGRPGMMELFLAEYGLSTDEGVALMCLAEALLRVPDAQTMDELIDDKITPSAWNEHLGKSNSSLVNASTWALMLTGKVLAEGRGVAASLRGAIKRLGEPVIRAATHQAMREMGRQFVLGETIEQAIKRGEKQQEKGFTYSYDMLGEAALTADDASKNFQEYINSIKSLSAICTHENIADNPGISIKLSAIHPRYEYAQKERVMAELVPLVAQLARMASEHRMGLNIDAEEADRLDLSLGVIEAVLRDPKLAGWDGFGVVVQAYGKRAAGVLDWLYALAKSLDRRIMVRLVKGAYWDSEIKHAQVGGLAGFPVFTHKEATDVSYICCAQKLLRMGDHIYPQFATHNAHTVAAVLALATPGQPFEFQRLHGMGEALHDLVLAQNQTKCRIYAPVGTHRDLLAYLVRRLLENGANSSFVNQIVSKDTPAKIIAADPFDALDNILGSSDLLIRPPSKLFGESRENSKGHDLNDPAVLAMLEPAREVFRSHQWNVGPMLVNLPSGGVSQPIFNPADVADKVGVVRLASVDDVTAAIRSAKPWGGDNSMRAQVLRRAADLFEENHAELFAILCREAGKTLDDAVSELREAIDFLRYYASEAERLTGTQPRGVICCISPWNFPLAIFTGQIAAALAAGNGVLAKPAEATPIVANLATGLLHRAGVPGTALQLLPGLGAEIGGALTSSADVAGICFTGSTQTAQIINLAMAKSMAPDAPLVAETGGINAMIIDSTALPEQAIQDVLTSAFKSAGQRCSALRVLYLQEDIAIDFQAMLFGAMDQLNVADPWDLVSDLGPIIDGHARENINKYINDARKQGQLLYQIEAPDRGHFIGPAVIKVPGIGAVTREIFGPVLHIVTYRADELEKTIDDINRLGYGLTFGMHSRIDDRVAYATSKIHAGNIYVNRNQIGAAVGSQPFGGHGLSGTGPKAGGPFYVERFTKAQTIHPKKTDVPPVDIRDIQDMVDAAIMPEGVLSQRNLPGPTGESNQLSTFGRGVILCLGSGAEDAEIQAQIVRQNGCVAVVVGGGLAAENLSELRGIDGVVLWASPAGQRAARVALAARPGPIIPLLCERHFGPRCQLERHICIDTTAAGGNAQLLAETS